MSKLKTSKTHNRITDKITLILVIFFIAIVPLLVRINMTDQPLSQFNWHSDESSYFDVFSKVKAEAILISGFVSICIIFINQIKYKVLNFKDPVLLIVIIMSALIALSQLLSVDKEMSLFGAPGRYEGTLVWFSYLSVFLLVYSHKWKLDDFKKIFTSFVGLNLVLSIIGIFQYYGVDLILNDILKPFITDSSMNGVQYNMFSKLDYKAIIQTLDHYNYVGFFLSLSLPIILTLALYERRIKRKLFLFVLIALMTFNLVGSTARGGLIGILIALPVFFICNRNLIFTKLRTTLLLLTLVAVVFIGLEIYSGGFLTNRLVGMFTTVETDKVIHSININQNSIDFNLKKGEFNLEVNTDMKEEWLIGYSVDGEVIEPILNEAGNMLIFNSEKLSGITISLAKYNEDTILVVNTYGQLWHFGYNSEGQLSYLNLFGKYDILTSPEAIGFEGHERLGSARGYIWSRSIPLILDKPWFGHGADTFVEVFPQQDYVGKYHAYYTTNMTVDKAHNVFVQVTFNFGIFFLFSYLLLNAYVFIRAKEKLYSSSQEIRKYQSAFLFALSSYFIASFFNDSTVHVSTVYWCILGFALSNSVREIDGVK